MEIVNQRTKLINIFVHILKYGLNFNDLFPGKERVSS